MNDTTKGIGRIANFNSKDQLVTLGFGGGPGPAGDRRRVHRMAAHVGGSERHSTTTTSAGRLL